MKKNASQCSDRLYHCGFDYALDVERRALDVCVPMSKRLFVAIDLPESTRRLLADLDPHIPGARWTQPDQMHLTLGFFGDVTEDVELKLREKIGAIAFGVFFYL
jgi:hypothetical protein